jgi:hypothetical protein
VKAYRLPLLDRLAVYLVFGASTLTAQHLLNYPMFEDEVLGQYVLERIPAGSTSWREYR